MFLPPFENATKRMVELPLGTTALKEPSARECGQGERRNGRGVDGCRMMLHTSYAAIAVKEFYMFFNFT